MTIYRRADRTVAADEALDEDGILRDGYSMSVPLMFRDGLSRDGRATRRIRKEVRDPKGRLMSTSEAIEGELDDDEASALADAGVAFHDGYGRPAGHRPGPCIPVDSELLRRRAVVQDAYKAAERADAEAWRKPVTWAGAAALPAKAPDHLMADALQMLDEKERAYREVAWADENAWRNVR